MESAIPPHLQCPRSRQRRVHDDYVPPYPAFVARHSASVTRVVMAYFGVQFSAESEATRLAIDDLGRSFAAANGPGHWDRARWTDGRGFVNVMFAAYWDDIERFKA